MCSELEEGLAYVRIQHPKLLTACFSISIDAHSIFNKVAFNIATSILNARCVFLPIMIHILHEFRFGRIIPIPVLGAVILASRVAVLPLNPGPVRSRIKEYLHLLQTFFRALLTTKVELTDELGIEEVV